VIGFFLDPGFLGLIFVFTLIILVIRTWQEKKQRNLLIIASLITYLALALTYSRASYLAFLTAMGTIAWWKKSAKFFLIIMLIGIFTLVLLPRPGGEGVKLERTSTIKARILSWQRALTIAQDNLLFGVGFNTYRYAQSRYGFESIEGLRISHSGAYLWLGTKAFGLVRRLRNNLEVISLATLLAVFIHSFFHNSLFYPWIMGWLWIVMALAKND
jgi:O-antigen ligase